MHKNTSQQSLVIKPLMLILLFDVYMANRQLFLNNNYNMYFKHNLILQQYQRIISRQLNFRQEICNYSYFHTLRFKIRKHLVTVIFTVHFSLSACADGYLTPHIRKYIRNFTAGFKSGAEVNMYMCVYVWILSTSCKLRGVFSQLKF